MGTLMPCREGMIAVGLSLPMWWWPQFRCTLCNDNKEILIKRFWWGVCDGPAGEQWPTSPNGGQKGRQRQPSGVVLDGRYYPKSCVIETPPYSGVSAYHTEVCWVSPAIRRPFKSTRTSWSQTGWKSVWRPDTHKASLVVRGLWPTLLTQLNPHNEITSKWTERLLLWSV